MSGSLRAATTSCRAASNAIVWTATASSRPRCRFSARGLVRQVAARQLGPQAAHPFLDQGHLFRRQVLHQVVLLEGRDGGGLVARGEQADGIAFGCPVLGGLQHVAGT